LNNEHSNNRSKYQIANAKSTLCKHSHPENVAGGPEASGFRISVTVTSGCSIQSWFNYPYSTPTGLWSCEWQFILLFDPFRVC